MTRPRFELRRVRVDGTLTPARLYPVAKIPDDLRLDRRGFLGAGVTAASVALLLKAAPGCGSCEKPPRAHERALGHLAVSPDGLSLYSSGWSSGTREAKAWALPSGALQRSFLDLGAGPEGSTLESFRVLPSGRMLAVSTDGRIRLWEALQQDPASWFDVQPQRPSEGLAVSGDGNTIAVGGGGRVALWSLGDRRRTTSLDVSGDSYSFSADGKRLLVRSSSGAPGTRFGALIAWSIADNVEQARLDLITPGAELALAPDGDTVVESRTSSEGVTTSLWSLSRNEVTVSPRTEANHLAEFGHVFSPDSRQILSIRAAVGFPNDVVIRDTASLAIRGALSDPDLGAAEVVRLSSDGQSAMVASKEGRIGLFDVTTRKLSRLLTDPAIRRERCGQTICTCVPVFV